MIRQQHISAILAILVAVSLFTGTTTAFSTSTTGQTADAPFDHERTEVNNSSASLDYEGEQFTFDTTANQTVRGQTELEPGTELQIQIHATSQFFKSQTVAVQPNGSFNATFNFTDYEPGTEFGLIVSLPENNSTVGDPLVSIDGVLGNGSAAETTTALSTTTTTGTTTNATTETTTEMMTEQETQTTITTSVATSDSGGQPGFGVAVALVALTGLGLLSRRY